MLFTHVKTLRKNSNILSFNRSNVPLDWLKKLKNSNLTIWLVRSILDRLSIDRKSNSIDRLAIEYQLIKKDWSLFHSIDRKQFSTYWNSWNLNFQKFSKVVFYGFSWTNNHHMNIIDREWYQNWISLIL